MDAQVQLVSLSPCSLLPPAAGSLVALAEAVAQPHARPLPCPLTDDPLSRADPVDPGLWALAYSLHAHGRPTPRELLAPCLESQPFRVADWSSPPARALFELTQTLAHSVDAAATAQGLERRPAVALAILSLLGELVSVACPAPRTLTAAAVRRRLARRWRWPAWLRRGLLQLDLPTLAIDLDGPERQRLDLVRAALRQLAREHPDVALPLIPQDEGGAGFALTVHPPGSNLPAPPPFSPAAAGVLRDSLRLGLALADRGPWLEPAWATPLEDEAEALRAQLAAVARQTEAERRSERLAALAEFAAGASHEINNPLAVISAQAQHLLRDEESPERVAGLRRIVAQCQRIHRVLRDVMLYARPPQPQAQAIRLEQVTKDVVRKLAELARERGVTLELGPGLRQRLLADAELIDLALTCLVQNGIEAAPKSGWVRISAAEPAEGLIAITVADSGSGLAPALLESCFDPLFSGRQAGRGLGMGLSKVWRIAQLHDGTIHVRSEPGQPTEFVLTLPLRPARGRTTLPGRAAARRNRDGRQQSKARPAGQPRPASVRKSVSRRRAAARRRR